VLEKEANNGRKALIHGVHDGRAILVPVDFDPAADPTPPAAKLA
jgi:hypothetical protein